jgi:hypothetical protein
MGHVLDDDITLSELLDLAPNWEAEREAVGKEWIRTPIPNEAHMT